MPRAKPIDLPHTVPELMALVREFEADLARRRSQKARAMARWRDKARRTKTVEPQPEGETAHE